VEVLVALGLVAMLVGQVVGQPILLGYVVTGSMNPTLEPGDGFVAVPPSLVGDIDEGDVVTFQPAEINGGKLTTHRVVGQTDRGYLTKGDANPFGDQAGDEPPVRREQIVAVALQSSGEVVVVPNLGDAVVAVQSLISGVQRAVAGFLGLPVLSGTMGLAYLLLAASALAYALDWYGEKRGKDRIKKSERGTRRGRDARIAVLILAVAIVIAATAAMLLPAGPQAFAFDSVEDDARGGIETGDTESITYTVRNGAFVPTVVMVESDSPHLNLEPERVVVPPRGQVDAAVIVTAPDTPGSYRGYIRQDRYLAVLPPSLISFLYDLHPSIPLLAVNAVLGGGFYLVGTRILGTARLKSRQKKGTADGLLGQLR
jgi:signal peptidase